MSTKQENEIWCLVLRAFALYINKQTKINTPKKKTTVTVIIPTTYCDTL